VDIHIEVMSIGHLFYTLYSECDEKAEIQDFLYVSKVIKSLVERIRYLSYDKSKILVISYRDNTIHKIPDFITWNSEYNEETDILKIKIKNDKRKKENERARNKNKENRRTLNDLILERDKLAQEVDDCFEKSNKYSILQDRCEVINQTFSDDIVPEKCISIIEEFVPVLSMKKPSEISFSKILVEHGKMVKSKSDIIDNVKASTDSDFKAKYEQIQIKLNELKSKVMPILIKHTKLKIQNKINKKGFVLSMIDAIKYFDLDYASPEEYDSEYD
jgi:hypothetical protein